MIINGQEIEKIYLYDGTEITDMNFKTLIEDEVIYLEEDIDEKDVEDYRKTLLQSILRSASKEGTYCLDLYDKVRKALGLVGESTKNITINEEDDEAYLVLDGDATDDEIKEAISKLFDVKDKYRVNDPSEAIILLYAMLILGEEEFEDIMITYNNKYGEQRYITSEARGLSEKEYNKSVREKIAMLETLKYALIRKSRTGKSNLFDY